MTLNTIELSICAIILLGAVYYYLTATYGFWKSRNVVGPTPILFFGNFKELMLTKLSTGFFTKSIYDQYPNEPMIGIYRRREPMLILNDLDQIKNVLIKDFNCFMDRGVSMNEKHEPLSAHLFNLEAKRWRPLRTKLTPVFTSGKLREMFHLLIECVNNLDDYLDRMNGKTVNIQEISARYATDVIGVCAFGLQANALANDDSTFREMGKCIFGTHRKNVIKFRILLDFPHLFNIIGGFLSDHVLNKFFLDLTRDTIDYRKKNNINRHDFIDLLMAIKDEPSKVGDIELTDSLMAAQLYVFFVGGFETSSLTMSNCLFELALNHNIRDKLREEIKEELSKTNGAITYEGIENMKYLERVMKETLRKYPPLPIVMRKAMTPYTFPGTKVSIPVGTRVWIPNFAIHRDPKYYPNPNTFDPERFTKEAIESRPHMTYLPFGDGPRNCIAWRFGRMQSKVGVVKILQNYTVEACNGTEKEYEFDSKAIPLLPKNGIMIRIIKQPMLF